MDRTYLPQWYLPLPYLKQGTLIFLSWHVQVSEISFLNFTTLYMVGEKGRLQAAKEKEVNKMSDKKEFKILLKSQNLDYATQARILSYLKPKGW